ncbi:MAG: hypothetical protein SGARI_001607 [Bacillariaceae sp.]
MSRLSFLGKQMNKSIEESCVRFFPAVSLHSADQSQSFFGVNLSLGKDTEKRRISNYIRSNSWAFKTLE